MVNYSYKILLIVVSCLFLQLLNAQNFQKIDSLELSLKFTENPKDKVEILLDISNEFKNNDPDKALNYAQEAYDISEEANYEKGILNSMIILAEIHWNISEYKASMDFATKLQEMAEEYDRPKELAQSLQLLGLIYSDLGDYDRSSNYYFESLKLNEQINNKLGIGKSLSLIATVFFDQQNYEKALDFYFRSLNIAKEINNRIGVASGLNNIAIVYGTKHEYEKASKYIEEAAEINKKYGNKRAEAINYVNLGIFYQRLNKIEGALVYLMQALNIFKILKNVVLIANCQINLGDHFLWTNDIERSMEYATKAFETGKKHGLKTIVHYSAELLNKIYLLKKDTLNAYKYDIIKYRMRDSLNIEKSNTEISRLELQYEFEKDEKEKQMKQQRKNFLIIIAFISLVSCLIVIILLFARQRVKAKNVRLKKQALETELEFNNKELTINVMSLIKKNELLSDISSELITVKNEAVKDHTKEAIKNIARRLKKSTEDETWKEFELRFKQVHGEFYSKLLENFPDLSSGEHRLCAFLRLNMSTKEISELTGQSVPSIEAARYRIRKKLGISNSKTNLIIFLSKI